MSNVHMKIAEAWIKDRYMRGMVNVFLMSGVKLQGKITMVSPECMELTKDGNTQLVMVRAIASVMPWDDNTY